ncbi:C6 zinc finger domain protein [Aspergillus tamarii]|uniref:C6 zinc finger domain protein n=1 Tax=Aspergillus tamarii TaxID=41984 RepID=A0A5N6V496_ASPTM|nr:C6 zinc finger domain protein [Aspergillus tamarii]
MALRRPHRKSRHGCLECKRRRVKCDETRPVCSNCSKRQTECEYDSSSSLLWANEEPHHTKSVNSRSEEPPLPEPPHVTANPFDPSAEDDGATHSSPSLNLGDLELMMQWCNSTYQVLTRNERTDPVWRLRVPEEALSHPFLMHGILALSALHIARTRDDHRRPEYISAAVAHQNQALAFFRKQLDDINDANAKALFALSSVIVVYTFGFPHSPESKDPWACIDDFIQVLVLARGVEQVLRQATPSIRSSDWEILLRLDTNIASLPQDALSPLERLRELNACCGAQDPTHDTDIYNKTIDNLTDITAAAYGGLTSITVAARWAIRLKPKFVNLIRDRSPLALVILAHLCAVLCRHKYDWCIDQWVFKLPRVIWQILDDRWKPYAQWPMVEIFGQDFLNETETD